jgi:hypothetical protein
LASGYPLGAGVEVDTGPPPAPALPHSRGAATAMHGALSASLSASLSLSLSLSLPPPHTPCTLSNQRP